MHTLNKGNLKFFVDTLFNDTDFERKRVLAIGGGRGILSFYAGCRGAKEVICLEPDLDGGSIGMKEKFDKTKHVLSLNNNFLEPITFQAYHSNSEPFDVILLI